MTFSATSSTPVTVTAYRTDPTKAGSGFTLVIGTSRVELTERQADGLGRYLLFDNATVSDESIDEDASSTGSESS